MTQIAVDPARSLGRLDRNVFGGFVEHLGRCIYGGLYRRGIAAGRRRRASARTCSTFSARCGWACCAGRAATSSATTTGTDGIGPKGRPSPAGRAGLGRRGVQPVRHRRVPAYCAELGTEPYICLNMGTGTLDEALAWVEYCNSAGQDVLGRPRRSNGQAEPYGVTLLGPGQRDVRRLAGRGAVRRRVRARRRPGGPEPSGASTPGIKLVSCGMNGWNDWDRVVIDGHVGAGRPPLPAHLHRVRRLLDQRAAARTRPNGRSATPDALIERAAYTQKARHAAADRLRRVERLVPDRRRRPRGALHVR